MAPGLSGETLLFAILLACLALAIIARQLLAAIFRSLSAKGRAIGPLLATHLSTVAAAFLAFGALFILMPLLGVFEESPILAQSKQVIFILLATWLAIRFITFLEAATYQQLDIAKPDNLEERKLVTQVKYIRATLVIIIAIVGFALILMTFEEVRRLGTGILASAGIASVASHSAPKSSSPTSSPDSKSPSPSPSASTMPSSSKRNGGGWKKSP